MSETHMTTQRFDPLALTEALKMNVGERAEWVDFDPRSGDYRVFYLAITATPEGGAALDFELHRQGPGFMRRVFPVVSLTLGPPDAEGLCTIETFRCDAGIDRIELPRLLPWLAGIVAALRERQRPADAWIVPLLSRSAKILWTKSLVKGSGS